MEALLLAIYSFLVWLIFIKFKWLPWNTTSQVTVVIIPIVGLAAMILTLNVRKTPVTRNNVENNLAALKVKSEIELPKTCGPPSPISSTMR